MATFKEDGFLADDLSFFADELDRRCGKLISLCLQLNKRAQAFQYSLDVHIEYLPEIVSSILYGRVLSTFQAAMLLSQRGMKQQVQMMIRCLLEPLFPLVAISKSKAFVNDYVRSEECERLKSVNRMIQMMVRNENVEFLGELKSLADSVKQKIMDEGIKPLSAYDCARAAGLQDYYDTLYSVMSDTLHASPRSLEEALEMDPEKAKIQAIKNEPDIDNIDSLLVTLVDLLLRAVSATAVIFNSDEPRFVQDLKEQMRAIG